MDFFAPLASYIKAPQQQTPEQQQQQALIEALRGMGTPQQSSPAQVGQVVSANAPSGGMDSGVSLGQSLGQLGKKAWGAFGGAPSAASAPVFDTWG